MNSQEMLNIVTISISTILSLGGILLSIWFYRESNKQNKETALMQTNIKNTVEKLEQLYNTTYANTFKALETQMVAMQNHIFPSAVGATNTSQPNELRLCILGCIVEKTKLSLDDLCGNIKGYEKTEIIQIVYDVHREGLINFDGKQIEHLINNNKSQGVGQLNNQQGTSKE